MNNSNPKASSTRGVNATALFFQKLARAQHDFGVIDDAELSRVEKKLAPSIDKMHKELEARKS